MSQAGQLNLATSNPSVPTSFVTDSGTAIALNNVIDINGAGGAIISATGNQIIVTAGGGGGGITGPVSSTVGDVVLWNNLTGTVVSDAGFGFPLANTHLANSSVTLSNGTNISVTGSPVSLGGTATINVSGPASATTLTAHGVVLGNGSSALNATSVGTNGQILVGSSAADPSWVTPSVGTGLSLTTNATTLQYALSTPVSIAIGGIGPLPTVDGQVLIASSTGNPSWATLTAGANVTITNGHNSITIASSGGGGGGSLTWSDQSISFTAAATNGYFTTAAITATMPASPTVGNTIAFAVDTTGVLTITANTGQTLRVGNNISVSAGTCKSTLQGDSITFVYRATDTCWVATQIVGEWQLT